MAIVTTTVDTYDGVDCTYVHMSELSLFQAQRYTDAEAMQATISIAYRKYATLEDGSIVVHPIPVNLVVEDVAALAQSKALAGDMSLVNAMAAIEAAIAVILSDAGREGYCEEVL